MRTGIEMQLHLLCLQPEANSVYTESSETVEICKQTDKDLSLMTRVCRLLYEFVAIVPQRTDKDLR